MGDTRKSNDGPIHRYILTESRHTRSVVNLATFL